ncbi:flagellar filament capping protein FliD [Pseudomonas sp. SZMC_28357]|uniref:flagellar filament capping protein FliD n=1 Tax=Pseudomonas sp. SZMC_28357 TaxID=3074380 RepID=UPI002870EA78|nr:flagellar filament capping protein FliD [Pseudomonas sp. SZMC_28357]MDR9750345.1 flagellar filament capping protein FliD [Pseudomonas sp. SZMC_28357]
MASPILPGTGLGSGLDTGAIVKALVNSDKAAKQGQIDRGTATNTASISGIGTLKSLLATFQTALKDLGSTTNPQFTGFAATSSDVKIAGAVANNAAVAGTYKIEITQVATSSKVASGAFAGGASSVIAQGGGLTITQNGKNYSVVVPDGSTLQQVRDSINSKFATDGLSANIVSDQFGARLVLGSSVTGVGSEISTSGIPSLTMNGAQKIGSPTTATSSGALGELPIDAIYTVDGLERSSKSNTITDVSGLSLTLLTKGNLSVTVAGNNDGLKASIQKFVDAYNAIANAVTSLTKPSLDDDGNLTVSAALTGDPLPRSLLAAIRAPLSQTGAGDKLTVLSQLGITTDQKTGALNFDSVKFKSAMEDKKLAGEVQTLFTGTNGLVERMNNVIKPYTDTGGILDTRTTNLNKIKTKLINDQQALDRRVETLTATLTKKYNDMDTLVGKLKATAANITSMFEAMNAQQKG